MRFSSVSLFTTLSFLSLTTSSPIDLPPYLQCHCITFPSPTISSPCRIAGSQNLSWSAARAFAASHDLQIQFASRDTVSKVLDAHYPVPTTLLLRAGKSESFQNPFLPEAEVEKGGDGVWKGESRVVCGVDEEIRRAWMKSGEVEGTMCDISILQIVMVLILLVIGFEALCTICSSLRNVFFRRPSPIRLSGGEKKLAAISEEDEEGSDNDNETSELEGSDVDFVVPIPEALAHLAQNTVEVHYRIAMPRGTA